jgi:adenylate cyclase
LSVLQTDVAPEAFRHALAGERLQSARVFTLGRFAGVSAFFALALVMGLVLRNPGWTANNWPVFAAYWAGAGLVFWFGRRSESVAPLTSLAIPLLDMPAVFALHWAAITHPVTGDLVAGQSVAYFVLLIVATVAVLDERTLVVAAVVAAVLEVALVRHAGVDPGTGVAAVLAIAMAAVVGVYVIRRLTRLVADVSAEQLRRERLGRYFSPQVAALIGGALDRATSGESREVTILFSDLREFTALAETLGGPRVVALLNDYHERMVRTIFAFNGTLDKYLGDGLLVYFGAPVPQADHAERAVRCALAMQDELERMNGVRAARGEAPLRMGIGVHTGTAILGDIGAPQRREYTLIGDAVNVAARLEELTKATGAPILVSASTRALVGEALPLAGVGPLVLRGRSQPMEAYVPRR